MDKTVKVTPSLEDYLEKIYFIYMEKGSVRVTDVAVHMEISKPSVNKAINILMKMGHIEHEHYGNLNLTESGISLAKSIAKRHFVLKRFLNELLGIDAKTAEEEACRIEHQMSAETVEKLAAYLDRTLE